MKLIKLLNDQSKLLLKLKMKQKYVQYVLYNILSKFKIFYFKVNALVAGSVGPYGATLHDRSEYSGHYVNNMTIEVYLKIIKLKFKSNMK